MNHRVLGLAAALGLLALAVGVPGSAGHPGVRPAAAAGTASIVAVSSGLSQPLVVTNAGDGLHRLFVVERGGRIRIVEGGALLSTPFLDVSSLVTTANIEQGLLGLAFHPAYSTNGYFFIDYTNTGGDTVIARYQASPPGSDAVNANSAQVLLTIAQPFANHNGGQLAFGPDGYLYIAMGDGGSGGDPANRAQDVNTLLGKILRIDVDHGSPYAIPATNPLVGQPGLDEIWAVGLRNPWRFSFDRATGDLLIGDVGQDAWEEVDLQPAGTAALRNYGWRLMEGTHCYNPSTNCDPGGLAPPILEYQHVSGLCAVIGGYRYRGASSPLLAGQYVYGDYCTGQIFGATLSGSTWTGTELINTPFSISAFGEDEAGELYVLNYSGSVLYRVVDPTNGDGDTVLDAVDNCPSTSNPMQTNSDSGPLLPAGNTGSIDNGPGIAGDDTTIPNGDATGDACETDRDNDGLPDSQDTEPLGATGICAAFAGASDGHSSPAGGDVTDADGNGPSWDTDGDGVRDGVECQLGTNPRDPASKPTRAACGGETDADGDGLPAAAERCKWGTSDTSGDSDGDARKDCLEANDTDGNSIQNFTGDTVNAAKAALGVIVKTMDFDLDGNGSVNFTGDTVLSAKLSLHVGGLCP